MKTTTKTIETLIIDADEMLEMIANGDSKHEAGAIVYGIDLFKNDETFRNETWGLWDFWMFGGNGKMDLTKISSGDEYSEIWIDEDTTTAEEIYEHAAEIAIEAFDYKLTTYLKNACGSAVAHAA